MITGATSLTSKQMEQLKKAFTDLSWLLKFHNNF